MNAPRLIFMMVPLLVAAGACSQNGPSLTGSGGAAGGGTGGADGGLVGTGGSAATVDGIAGIPNPNGSALVRCTSRNLPCAASTSKTQTEASSSHSR